MNAIGLALIRPALRHSSSKVLKHANRGVPVNASIGDGHALLQAAGALRRHLLVALIDVGLDHDTDDAGLAVADLVGNVLGDLGLVAVVFVGVACVMLDIDSLGVRGLQMRGEAYRESSQPS